MGRLSIATSLFVLLLSMATAPLSYAAPKACAAGEITTTFFHAYDPKTEQAVYAIITHIDGGDGVMLPTDAPSATAQLKVDGATSTTLQCKDGGSLNSTAVTHLYGCIVPQDVAGSDSKFQFKFQAQIDNSPCQYSATLDSDTAEDMILSSPEKIKQEMDACEGLGCIFVALGSSVYLVIHDLIADLDGDGVAALQDPCPFANGSESTSCSGTDQDGDGIDDDDDICAFTSNADQADMDANGIGDACDEDRDGDEHINSDDNCPNIFNPSQKDKDKDGLGDACDDGKTPIPCATDTMICTTVPGTYCDPVFKQCLPMLDTDRDGTPDIVDECPNTGTELDPCGSALPATVFAPPPSGPATGSADGGGGCSLQTSAPEHSTGVYLLLSFIAVLSALGITRTTIGTKQ